MAFFIRYFFVFNSVLYIPAIIVLYAGLMYFYTPVSLKLPGLLNGYLLFAGFLLFLKMTYELKIQKVEIAWLKTLGLTILELSLLRLLMVAVYLALSQAGIWILHEYLPKLFPVGRLFMAALKILLIEGVLGLTWYPLYIGRDLRLSA